MKWQIRFYFYVRINAADLILLLDINIIFDVNIMYLRLFVISQARITWKEYYTGWDRMKSQLDNFQKCICAEYLSKVFSVRRD
jgi:hypothetical protein